MSIFNHDLVKQAALLARFAHYRQVRKYTYTPYFQHAEEVAHLIAGHAHTGFASDPYTIAAAYLHDVLEDCPRFKRGMIGSLLDPRVETLVVEVTDISRPEDGDRETRKRMDAAHLSIASAAGQTIKCADIVSSTASIVSYDPKFTPVYLEEQAQLLSMMKVADDSLWDMANDIVSRSMERISA